MPPHSEQIVSRICGALFRGSLTIVRLRIAILQITHTARAACTQQTKPLCGVLVADISVSCAQWRYSSWK
ncbi:hypothetical protein BRM22_19840 [Xanthomonas oryzae pv. oryzae]|nr:hypothetical protein BRM27_13595 [Xanthomonas oryzae pv. oryzae]RBD75711.1 hypothetical protein BRM19_01345 [Xanthomonas oryzae pv. oryzae]RBE18168.1 hypothetical protein BRL71_13930 [Xanthomonas oryzae pv. oryzae]RBE18206.1 hypothetical protein BRL70_14210 [Xanthomonas oryzae pv. oryzae]RBF24277.1 hypothetical protein BRM98_17565 [Xanthomonas oryzae pv. oryzae]